MANEYANLTSEVISLRDRYLNHETTIGVVGLGYVGLPLVRTLTRKGYKTVGFDVDVSKVESLESGKSYIRHIPDAEIAEINSRGLFQATTNFELVSDVDAVLICVPTPLNRYREPDMSYVVGTTETIAPYVKAGQLVVLESTTYPGTTDEVMRPILEAGGLRSGVDLYLAYSPEREDPGNPQYETATIPKVVGGDGEAALALAQALYSEIVAGVVPVTSTATAEAVKLTENIFRSVNIALVNELKVVYEKMGIDIWEVIDAAKSKPFGFMPFYPGPGLGGHCIPIDPFYLTWKAREFDVATRFIELAGEINTAMPEHVVRRVAETLDRRFAKGLNGSKLLLMGMAYKKNVDDMRESPSLVLMEMLQERGAEVDYHDPYVPEILRTREHPDLSGMRSVSLTPDRIAAYDAVLISTDHDDVDYDMLVANARLVVDTRNATKAVTANRDKIVKA